MSRPDSELAHLFRQLKAPAAARALPKLAEYRSHIGARQTAIEHINHGLGEMQLYLENQISGIEDPGVSRQHHRAAWLAGAAPLGR